MDPAEVAAKVCALEAELAATSPRIADLEARVSLLEAENARWRRAVPRGEIFGGRLEEGLSGSKQATSQKVGASFHEVGDGDEMGMAADVSNRRGADDGVLALSTPKKLAVQAVTGGSDDEDDTDDATSGGGGDHRSIHFDGIVDLEDDDVSITPCGKKRARVIDSDDEGENGRNAEMQEGGVTPSRKRVFRGLSDSDNEDNGEGVTETRVEENLEDDSDDNKPICEVVKKMREKRMREEMKRLDDVELGDTEGRSMPTTSPSAHLVENQSQKVHLEMDHTLLKDVTQDSHCWRVRVRITRISRCMTKYQPHPQLNFVMLDEQGGMMEGQVPAWLTQRLLRLIREDVVYYIHYFEVQVINRSPTHRAVDHPFMAMFRSHTKISEDTDVADSFPMYAYKLSSYEVLRSRENNTVLMSDAIGLLMGVSHVRTVPVKGVRMAIRDVYISNGRETAVVVLWGAHAHQFPAKALQQQLQQGPVAILFVALTVKLYEGKLSLQGSKGCRWYPNALVPEVIALLNSSAGVSDEVKWFGSSPARTRTVRVCVGDIWDLNPHETLGNAYDVDIAIKSLVPDEPWWYVGCQGCKKTIFKYGYGYKCSNCGGTVEEIRYRLALLGLDPLRLHDKELNAAEFVFFGDIGEQLTGASALTLIATGQGINDNIPHEITRLYGRHYNLKVNVSRGSLRRERISYQVYSMTALPTPSTMPLREVEKNTTTPSASVETHDSSSSHGTRSTNVHEKEKNDSLQHVDMGNTSAPASRAMDAAAATSSKNKQVSTQCCCVDRYKD
ncbi:hypothetical protein ACQ4PT_056492 [Festuca glaucescens]